MNLSILNKKILLKNMNWIVPLILLIIVPPLVRNSFFTNLLILGLLWGIVGSILDLTVGYAGLSNFGFTMFLGIGAYVSALGYIKLGISPWLGILLAAISAALLGAFVGFITLRTAGFYLAIITWFVAEVLKYLFAEPLIEITRGYLGLSVPPFPSIFSIKFTAAFYRLPQYYLLLSLVMITLIALRRIANSGIGMAFKAMRDDELAAQTRGINTAKYRILNLTITGFFAGLFGSYYAHYSGGINPDLFSVNWTVLAYTTLFVGGRGSIWGPMVAGIILAFFLEIFRPLIIIRLILYGVLLVIVMMFFPGGIASLKPKLEKYFWKK